MQSSFSRISKWQHILAWTSLFGLVFLHFAIYDGGFSAVNFKELLKQVVPDLIAALIAIIVAYFLLIKLEISSEEEQKVFFSKILDDKLSTLKGEISKSITNDEKLINVLSHLSNHVTVVTWASDSEEHNANVFKKMSEYLDDSFVTGMDVVSIFHKESTPKGEGKKAVEHYYEKIENAIRNRKFRYRRVVVVRKPINNKKNTESLSSIVKERIEFSDHCNTIRKFHKENADIKFLYTEGRVIDVAFAIFYQGGVQDKNVRNLVIEITVWNTEKSHHVMGLLGIEHPSQDLIKAFGDAFIGVYEGNFDKNIKGLEQIF